MSRPDILAAVSVALALEELDHIKAVECLPTPEALMQRLQGRETDFNLLVGVAGAFLNGRGHLGGCSE